MINTSINDNDSQLFIQSLKYLKMNLKLYLEIVTNDKIMSELKLMIVKENLENFFLLNSSVFLFDSFINSANKRQLHNLLDFFKYIYEFNDDKIYIEQYKIYLMDYKYLDEQFNIPLEKSKNCVLFLDYYLKVTNKFNELILLKENSEFQQRFLNKLEKKLTENKNENFKFEKINNYKTTPLKNKSNKKKQINQSANCKKTSKITIRILEAYKPHNALSRLTISLDYVGKIKQKIERIILDLNKIMDSHFIEFIKKHINKPTPIRVSKFDFDAADKPLYPVSNI